MVHSKHLLAGVGLALSTCLALGTAEAQTRWTVATPFAESNFHTQNIRTFSEEVKECTNGQLELSVHSGGSLVGLADIMRAVQTGQSQAGELLLFAFGNEHPMFELDTIPFVAVGYDQARELMELQRPHLDRALEERGLVPLFYVAWPGQGIVSQKLIESVEDLRGSKVRTAGRTTARFAELIGAQPVIIQTAEIAQAFLTGVADSSIYSPTTAVDTQAWDYAEYFHNTLAMHSKNAFVVNKAALAALNDEHRACVVKAAATAEARGWKMSEQRQDEALAELAQQDIEVVQPSDELMAQLRQIGTAMLEEWVEQAGPAGKELVKGWTSR